MVVVLATKEEQWSVIGSDRVLFCAGIGQKQES
jgi:hypothetical protein